MEAFKAKSREILHIKKKPVGGPFEVPGALQGALDRMQTLSPQQQKLMEVVLNSMIDDLEKRKRPNIVYEDTIMDAMGAGLTPEIFARVLADFWEQKKAGHIISEKLYIYFDDNHDWTYGVLSGATETHCGIKEIHFAPDHPVDQPLQKSLIIVRDKRSGVLDGVHAGEKISNGRTGYNFLPTIDLLPKSKLNIDVALVGAGSVAQALCEFIILRKDLIGQVFVYSKRGESNHVLADKFNGRMDGKIIATDDRTLIKRAKIFVGATNAGEPVCTIEELNPDVSFLSLGIGDTPKELMERILAVKGIILLDDAKTHEKRNSSSVARYYSDQGKLLTQDGPKDVIMELADVFADPVKKKKCLEWSGPRIIGPVGIVGTDILPCIDDFKRLDKILFD